MKPTTASRSFDSKIRSANDIVYTTMPPLPSFSNSQIASVRLPATDRRIVDVRYRYLPAFEVWGCLVDEGLGRADVVLAHEREHL